MLERSDAGLYPAAGAGSRITVGHPEGFVGAFANIYKALHQAIAGAATGDVGLRFPTVDDGADIVAMVHAAVRSATLKGAWVDAKSQAPL